MSGRVRLAIFIVGLACLALLVAHVGVSKLIADVRHAGPTLALVILLWAPVYAMNTATWLLLIDDTTPDARRLSFGRAFVISVSSFALNYVTPFVALGGEALRMSSAAAFIGGARATASVVAFRIVHTAGQIVFWLLTVPVAFVLLPPTTLTRVLLTLTALILGAITLALVALLRARTFERFLSTLQRVPGLGRLAALSERHRPAILALDIALDTLSRDRPARLAAAIVIEAASRGVATIEFLLIARSVGAPVSYAGATLITAFTQLVMNILFFMPFELGAREGGLFAIFKLLGYGPRVSVATALVSRLRELTWIAIGLALLWLGGAKSKPDEEQRSIP